MKTFIAMLIFLFSISAYAQSPVSSSGPSTDRAITIWNGIGGNTVQNSPITIGIDGSLQMPQTGGPVSIFYFPSGFANSSMFIGNGGRYLAHFGGLEGYYNFCAGQRCMTNATTASYDTGGGFEVMERCETCSYNAFWGEAAGIYDMTGLGRSGIGWKTQLGTPGKNFGSYNASNGYYSLSAGAIPGADANKIDAASWGPGAATFTLHVPHSFIVGSTITVTGVNPVGYNQAYTVSAVPDSFHVTVAMAVDPGAYVRDGYVDDGVLRNFNVADGPWALSNQKFRGSYNYGGGFNAGPQLENASNNVLIASANAGAGIVDGNGNVIIGSCPTLPPHTTNQVMICNGAGTIVFRNP